MWEILLLYFADVVLNAFIQFKIIICVIQINVMVLQKPPEPFDPDIDRGIVSARTS
jgi:hypothetical protein